MLWGQFSKPFKTKTFKILKWWKENYKAILLNDTSGNQVHYVLTFLSVVDIYALSKPFPYEGAQRCAAYLYLARRYIFDLRIVNIQIDSLLENIREERANGNSKRKAYLFQDRIDRLCVRKAYLASNCARYINEADQSLLPLMEYVDEHID